MNELRMMLKSVREVNGDAVNLIDALAGDFRRALSKGQIGLGALLIAEAATHAVSLISELREVSDTLLTRILIGEVQPSDALACLIGRASDGAVLPEHFAESAKIEPRGRKAAATLGLPDARAAGAGEASPPATPAPMPQFRVSRRGVAVLRIGAVRHDLTAAQLEALVPAAQQARESLAAAR